MRTFSKLAAAAALTLSLGAISAPANAAITFGTTYASNLDLVSIGPNQTGTTVFGQLFSDQVYFTSTDVLQTVDQGNNAFVWGDQDGSREFTDVSYGFSDDDIYFGKTNFTLTFNCAQSSRPTCNNNVPVVKAFAVATVTLLNGQVIQAFTQGPLNNSNTFTIGATAGEKIASVNLKFFADPGQTIERGAIKLDSVEFGGVGVVPEPGTWALMIVGFGGAGAMLRSRRRQAMAV